MDLLHALLGDVSEGFPALFGDTCPTCEAGLWGQMLLLV